MKEKSFKETRQCYAVLIETHIGTEFIAIDSEGMPAVFERRNKAIRFCNGLKRAGLKGTVIEVEMVLSSVPKVSKTD